MAIADVYSAGEAPIDGISRDTLVGGLIAHGHRRALPLAGEEALADFARAECRPGDMLVCLGAGSISAWANALPERLNAGQPPQGDGRRVRVVIPGRSGRVHATRARWSGVRHLRT